MRGNNNGRGGNRRGGGRGRGRSGGRGRGRDSSQSAGRFGPRACFECGLPGHNADVCPDKGTFTDLDAVTETDVGITGYATSGDDLPGLGGAFKERFTDFLVNEIDYAGNIVHLRTLGVPEPGPAPTTKTTPAGNASGGPAAATPAAAAPATAAPAPAAEPITAATAEDFEIDVKGLSSALPEAVADLVAKAAQRVTELAIARGSDGSQPTNVIVTLPETTDSAAVVVVGSGGGGAAAPDADSAAAAAPSPAPPTPVLSGRELRIAVHRAVREHLRGIASRTDNGTLCLTSAADATRDAGAKTERKRKRDTAPGADPAYIARFNGAIPGQGRYTHFTVHKENIDTTHLVRVLHSTLGTRELVGVMGNKDKRGVTVQRVSIQNLDPARLARIAAPADGNRSSLAVGDVTFERDGLFLGMGNGNHFTVVLRRIDAESAAVERAMQALSTNGFINYFGLQRFGNSRPGTHDIGRLIVANDFAGAVRTFTDVREQDKPALMRVRKLYAENRNAAAAANALPPWASVEQTVFRALAEHGESDPLAVLGALPRQLRTLYVHAYQSFVWNRAASERVRRHGAVAVAGDIVLRRAAARHAPSSSLLAPEAENPAEITLPVASGQPRPQDPSRMVPHILTAEEAATTPVTEVVLPVPGSSVELPTNDIGALYVSLLESDGLSMESFRRNPLDGSIKGDYRTVFVGVADLKWDLFEHVDPNADLTVTDLARLSGKTEPRSEAGAEHRSLRMSFSLPKSAYASMLVREVSRVSTSTADQVARARKFQQSQESETRKPGQEDATPDDADVMVDDEGADATRGSESGPPAAAAAAAHDDK